MTYGTGEFSGVTGDVKGGDKNDAGT